MSKPESEPSKGNTPSNWAFLFSQEYIDQKSKKDDKEIQNEGKKVNIEQNKQDNANKNQKKEPKLPSTTPNQPSSQNASTARKKKKTLELADFLLEKPTAKPVLPPFIAAITGPTNPQSAKISSQSSNVVENPNSVAAQRFITRRGKERETPKPKKYTKLKKIILKEREEKYAKWVEEKKKEEDGKQGDSGLLDLTSQVSSLQMPSDEHDEDDGSESSDSSDSDQDEDTKSNIEVENHDENEETSLVPSITDVSNDAIDPETSSNSSDTTSIADKDKKNKSEGGISNNNSQISGNKISQPPKPESGKEIFERLSKIPRVPTKNREYCKQLTTPELIQNVTELLSELRRFHLRLKLANPTKAKAKRRYLSGLREISRALHRKKVKCVILATNIEGISAQGGLDDLTFDILKCCEQQRIPVVFAMKRYALGRAMGKRISISSVGIINYEGANELYNKMIQLAKEGRVKWNGMMKEKEKQQQTQQQEKVPDEKSISEMSNVSPKKDEKPRQMKASAPEFVPRFG